MLMHIPISPAVCNAFNESSIQTSSADFGNTAAASETSASHSEQTLQLKAPGALREFGSILSDSAVSMKAEVPLVTTADKSAWWRQRLALDQRMADLLKHLDAAWLGPWR